ncbi:MULTISPECIES: hypothetical protein [unclassified Streptomyces]|uniref:hypothetical protein n=1 Tax=unclassified Streptomyces TaxID=2593676 RepID=UPI001161D1C3|nr:MULTISPECIES: hypothetical protein [unclassified Streptomyces]QDN88295.1 hypothetical protein FNV61_24210 [Streptomyces sp. RLB3-6]QDO09148.1 hypothetical protein FNV68_25460 [Streptomyces sp. S1D4-23]
MIELGVLFGLLVAAVLVLLFVLLRRRNGSTENVDGRLIEQARRLQAYNDRVSYNASNAQDLWISSSGGRAKGVPSRVSDRQVTE